MQPPPGYPQQGQPPYPQQQYGMQQMPYYPPQKQGMPGWAWALIICGILFAVMIVGILALAAIPLITSNTRDARRTEGKLLLHSARDMARIEYSKQGVVPISFSRFEVPVDPSILTGKYYGVDDPIRARPGGAAEITCSPRQTMSDGAGRLEFRWADGEGMVKWDH